MLNARYCRRSALMLYAPSADALAGLFSLYDFCTFGAEFGGRNVAVVVFGPAPLTGCDGQPVPRRCPFPTPAISGQFCSTPVHVTVTGTPL